MKQYILLSTIFILLPVILTSGCATSPASSPGIEIYKLQQDVIKLRQNDEKMAAYINDLSDRLNKRIATMWNLTEENTAFIKTLKEKQAELMAEDIQKKDSKKDNSQKIINE